MINTVQGTVFVDVTGVRVGGPKSPLMWQMNRAIAREQAERQAYDKRVEDRFASTLVIGACIIAGRELDQRRRRRDVSLYLANGIPGKKPTAHVA